jgi:hypothetical protein
VWIFLFLDHLSIPSSSSSSSLPKPLHALGAHRTDDRDGRCIDRREESPLDSIESKSSLRRVSKKRESESERDLSDVLLRILETHAMDAKNIQQIL